MTLDTWLKRTNDLPPAKRARCECNDISEGSTPRSNGSPPIIMQPAKRSVRFAPPPFHLQGHDLSDMPPEILIGNQALRNWRPSPHFVLGETPTCIETFPQHPFAAVAANGAQTAVHIVDCRPDSDTMGRTQTSVALPLDWPVNSMTRLGDTTLLCGSQRGISKVDLVKEGAEAVASRFDVDFVDEITVVRALPRDLGAEQTPVVAVGTSSGSLRLWDLRERLWQRSWAQTHAVTAGPRAGRLNPAVAHVAWLAESTLATASRFNESVKFWDVRGRTKAPIMTTQAETRYSVPRVQRQASTKPSDSWSQPPSSSHFPPPARPSSASLPSPPASQDSARSRSRTPPAGASLRRPYINGLVSDGSRNLWALSSSGALLQLNSMQAAPESRIVVTGLALTAPDQTLTHFEHMGYPMLACGGRGGPTLVTEPSRRARELGVDAVRAMRLTMPMSAVSALAWQPYSRQLVALCNGAWMLWDGSTARAELRLQRDPAPPLRSLRARQQPVAY